MTDKHRAELAEAERLAALWQYRGNRAAERGDYAVAERHYARSQPWRDKMHDLLGNGPLT